MRSDDIYLYTSYFSPSVNAPRLRGLTSVSAVANSWRSADAACFASITRCWFTSSGDVGSPFVTLNRRLSASLSGLYFNYLLKCGRGPRGKETRTDRISCQSNRNEEAECALNLSYSATNLTLLQ